MELFFFGLKVLIAKLRLLSLVQVMATLYLLLLLLLACFIPSLASAADSINQSQSIKDGDTIVSGGGIFELGFFSPGSSTARYVGIWYKEGQTKPVVWVANGNNPINDFSGVLLVNSTGSLLLLSQNHTQVLSASSTGMAQNPILQLLDTGNLVLRDGNNASSSEVYLWQSFDYPSNTFLPGMKLGKDFRTGHVWSYTSWKSPDDPSPGNITWGLENLNYLELVGRKNSIKYFSSGPWNGITVSQFSQQTNKLFSYNVVSDQYEVYYMYHASESSPLMRVVVNETSSLWERSTYSEATRSWTVYFNLPSDYCDTYGICGAYGKCQTKDLPYCQCLKRFSPKFPNKWDTSDWSGGCVRNKRLSCGTGDGFIKYSGLRFPDSTNTSVNTSIDLKKCRDRCLSNCSCMAYANIDIRGGGSGCAMWFSDLINMKELPPGGLDIYVRMAASEIEKDGLKAWKAVVAILVIGAAAAMIAALYYIRKKRKGNMTRNTRNSGPDDDLEFPLFDLEILARATNDFSVQNKLGEGGFGPVYKGILADGKEIAVKRLSGSSTQGVKEFKNEIILIANLQHRNLVKLLGCCIHGEERMLIYEYMPNGSLNAFIFDPTRRKNLDWGKRFHIICGIARGLLYLHQDSRLRIIHRDIKAGNVLLDNEMNPKISDFGTARMFGGDETEGNTNRVVGTHGYMAPEYAIDGLFSIKSDVFSFGVLVLETVSGRRNRGVYNHLELSLIGYAWNLYNERNAAELLDPCLVGTCPVSDVFRCIHIALLCLQEHAEDRPSMTSVVLMLSGERSLPQPKSPPFLGGREREQSADNSSSSNQGPCSNEMTVSLIDPR